MREPEAFHLTRSGVDSLGDPLCRKGVAGVGGAGPFPGERSHQMLVVENASKNQQSAAAVPAW